MANYGWATVAVGSQLGSQSGYPGHPANPPHAGGRPRSQQLNGWTAFALPLVRAQRPGAYLLPPDGYSMRLLQPRVHSDFSRAGRARQVNRCEDRWMAGMVKVALTAVCQPCSN